jgi:hypothetical protein
MRPSASERERPRMGPGPDHGMLCRSSWRLAAQEALINCEILAGEATEAYLVQAIARICESPHRRRRNKKPEARIRHVVHPSRPGPRRE